MGEESTRGGPPASHKGGGRAPRPCRPPGGPPTSIFCYMVCFDLKKIRRNLSGRSAAISRWNLGRTNLEFRRSCSAGETSLREGEIITVDPLIGRGSISINIFTNTISSQTLVHLLYPVFVPKPQIGTSGLLVVLITPCS